MCKDCGLVVSRLGKSSSISTGLSADYFCFDFYAGKTRLFYQIFTSVFHKISFTVFGIFNLFIFSFNRFFSTIINTTLFLINLFLVLMILKNLI